MHDDVAGTSGTHRKIALQVVEIRKMSPHELAQHVLGLGQPAAAVLTCVFDYLSDKPDVLFGMLRHMGLLRDATLPVLELKPDTAKPDTEG